MQLFLYRKSKNGLFGSSSDASVPDFRLRRSEKMPSSNFFEFLTGRPKAWKRKERQRTMSVPEMRKRLFLQPCCQPVHWMRIPSLFAWTELLRLLPRSDSSSSRSDSFPF